MTSDTDISWQGWRAVPWSTWLFAALAVLYGAVRLVDSAAFSPLATLVDLSPLIFAAAVAYARPADRRFRWAAWAIAGYVVLPFMLRLITDLVFSYVPGDLSNAALLVRDVLGPTTWLANALLIVGVAVFGIALGGVRSAFGGTIVVMGGFVAAGNLTWFFAHPIEEVPLLDIVMGAMFSAATPLVWAFVFAAAVDAVRSLLIVGSGLLFANVVVNAVLLWWAPGPGTNFDLLLLLGGGLVLGGWLALATGALRSELIGPVRVRSRADRRTQQRPAG